MTQIFIVDDDREDCEMLADTLKIYEQNAVCTRLHNGKALINLLQDENSATPDLIYLDLNMAGMNGFVALKELRRFRSCDEIPVIMYTTSDSESDISKCRELGADHFISKPVDYGHLKNILRSVALLKVNGRYVRSNGAKFVIDS